MKKIISFLLTLTLLSGLVSWAAAEDLTPPPSDGEEAALEVSEELYTDLTVGSPTQMHGHFFTGMWGNSTSDVDTRNLLYDYSLVLWDGEMGIFRFNQSVVSGAVVADARGGSRTYYVALANDMYYSDGTPITAWDYAFSVLLQCSPVISELGGNPANFSYLLGFEDYVSGKAEGLAGLRVMGDYMLLFTVTAESLPYFYEMSRLSFNPYPIKVIAPGCKVFDSGNGAYIANENGQGNDAFSASLLQKTIMDPQTGYLYHPSVVTGPYVLDSFDGLTAEFSRNLYYKGNEKGELPHIRHLTYTLAHNEDMIEKLTTSEFGLLNKVTLASTITEGLNANGEETLLDWANYPRIGLTYLYFSPESPAMQENAVRKAIAMCMDRSALVSQYTGYYGLAVEGLYGLGQWMYQLASGTLAPPIDPELSEQEIEEATKDWEKINLDGLVRYELDAAQAAALLEKSGWTLNAEGVRQKETAQGLITLKLRMLFPEGSEMEGFFQEHLIPYLNEAGIQVTMQGVNMNDLVDIHSVHDLESADIFYFGDNFNISFDPSLFFPAHEGATGDNLAAVQNELNILANDMAHTEPTDLLGYMQKWVTFQEKFTDLLPMLPVYSNIYFDFYTPLLHEYSITEHATWATAIVPARLYEDTGEIDFGEDEDEFDFLDDDTMFFDD